jgi:hypothetical protein
MSHEGRRDETARWQPVASCSASSTKERVVIPHSAAMARMRRAVDPDGNGRLRQEVTTRLPGRVDADDPTFTSSTELATALRRAAAGHGKYEKRTGQRDA